jgi:hypothetical protein
MFNQLSTTPLMMYGGVEVQIHIFLTSALVCDEWSASRPGRFSLGERAPPGTHWIGGSFRPFWTENASDKCLSIQMSL